MRCGLNDMHKAFFVYRTLEDTIVGFRHSLIAEPCCAFRGAETSTKFGLIEVYMMWLPNWIFSFSKCLRSLAWFLQSWVY